jgi:uroporphyrin-3 C-methyltransferase|tara:strand:- start:1224 stop:2360 length:1137 start_codon:yes stop_codon:yes gene_type:complete
VSNEQKNSAPSAPIGKEKKDKGASNALSWINLILIIILFLMAGFAGWIVWQQNQSATAESAVLKDRLGTALQKIEASNARENALMKRAEALNETSLTLAEQVAHNSERLGKLPGAERQDWLLAEAEYLLRLANQRLELERDWDGAVSMLTAADNVLIETRNPRLDKVRAQIARELMALRAVPAVDRVGAIFRLQALQEQVTSLPWMPEKLIPDVAVEEEPRVLEEQTWYWNAWFTVKDNVTRMVRIRERDAPIAAPLTPDQQYYLQQNMHLMLEQAQVALLREQTELYTHSLGRVQEWLDQYLVMEDERTRAARAALAQLAAWDVSPERPDVTKSLILLQKLVEEQRRGSVNSAAPVKAQPKVQKKEEAAPAQAEGEA